MLHGAAHACGQRAGRHGGAARRDGRVGEERPGQRPGGRALLRPVARQDARAADERAKVEDIGRHFKYGVLGFAAGSAKSGGPDKLASDVEFVSHEDSQRRSKGKGWTV